jgi:UDP-N-acetylglucosamine:LPS N-acetylglucosamine transferase
MRFLIFYTLAGGGHQQAAKALESELINQGHHVVSVDLGNKDIFSKFIFGQLYVILVERLYPIWILLTLFWKTKIGIGITKLLFNCNFYNYIEKAITENQPDKIISTYFFASELSNSIIPNVTIFSFVSELYSAPAIWFTSHHIKYLVCNETIKTQAINSCISELNIKVLGLFYNPEYDIPVKENEIEMFKQHYNISLPVISLIGGGSSLPKGYQTVKALLNTSLNYNFIICCGRNEQLKKDLDLLTINDKRFIILGFTNQLKNIISISSIIITKAGPSIITEILALHKPMIINHYIWEQEKGNVQYIINNEYGIYQPSIPNLITKIQELDQNKQWVKCLQNTHNFNSCNNINNIAKFVINAEIPPHH